MLNTLDRFLATLTSPSNEHADLARRFHRSSGIGIDSLGRLESIGVQLCGIYGSVPPPALVPAVALFAADHGTPPAAGSQRSTHQMVQHVLDGRASVCTLSNLARASLTIVDVGLRGASLTSPYVVNKRVKEGSGDIVHEPAMSIEQAEAALDIGADLANELADEGANVIIGGEITSNGEISAATIIAGICSDEPMNVASGTSNSTQGSRAAAVQQALDRCGDPDDPVELLAEVGGLEIAALAGLYLAAASRRIPVVLDGPSSIAAALVAHEIHSVASRYFFAGHRSADSGAAIGLSTLRLRPILDLELREGQGTGACMAFPILDGAARLMDQLSAQRN